MKFYPKQHIGTNRNILDGYQKPPENKEKTSQSFNLIKSEWTIDKLLWVTPSLAKISASEVALLLTWVTDIVKSLDKSIISSKERVQEATHTPEMHLPSLLYLLKNLNLKVELSLYMKIETLSCIKSNSIIVFTFQFILSFNWKDMVLFDFLHNCFWNVQCISCTG